jgi:hypothetical protein
MPKLLRDELEMIHTHVLPVWQGSIPQRLMASGGMSLAELDAEISRGEALERLQERLPDLMTEVQRSYLNALRLDRNHLVARKKL